MSSRSCNYSNKSRSNCSSSRRRNSSGGSSSSSSSSNKQTGCFKDAAKTIENRSETIIVHASVAGPPPAPGLKAAGQRGDRTLTPVHRKTRWWICRACRCPPAACQLQCRHLRRSPLGSTTTKTLPVSTHFSLLPFCCISCDLPKISLFGGVALVLAFFFSRISSLCLSVCLCPSLACPGVASAVDRE